MGRCVRHFVRFLKVLSVFLYICASVATIAYKRWLFSPKRKNFRHPYLIAAAGKLGQTIVVPFVIIFAQTAACKARLWNARGGGDSTAGHIRWCHWAPWIVTHVSLSAATLAADTLVYRYLDLTTKQIIDFTAPVAVLMVGFFFYRIFPSSIRTIAKKTRLLPALNEIAPSGFTEESGGGDSLSSDFDNKNATAARRCGLEAGRVITLLGIVGGTGLTAWHVATEPNAADRHGVSWLGLTLDGCTLLTSSVSVLIAEHMLSSGEWSPFRLIAVHSVPELILLLGAAFALDEGGHHGWSAHILRETALYAAPIAAGAIPLALVSITVLMETSATSAMVLGNAVMGLVIVADFVYFEKHTRISWLGGTGLAVSVFSVICYTFFCYLRNRAARPIPPAYIDPELSIFRGATNYGNHRDDIGLLCLDDGGGDDDDDDGEASRYHSTGSTESMPRAVNCETAAPANVNVRIE
jgi:hypothetical protein